jgi:hypothetical protein
LHTEEREGDKPEQLLLAIKHLETPKLLFPESLWIGEQNVLYCRVMEDRIPARFLRPAYYQLAEFIHEDKEQNRFYLWLREKRFYIG